MLTFESIVKATRQMSACGEVRTGALDHLPSRVTGFSARRRGDTPAPVTGDGPRLVRRWNDELGVYEYIEA